MGDPFRVYEAGRKAMYAGMEFHDEDPATSRSHYVQALKHFEVRTSFDSARPGCLCSSLTAPLCRSSPPSRPRVVGCTASW